MVQDSRAPGAPLIPLYPPIEPFATGMLDLEGPHRMYYEQSGNPRGIPVVFLHGGPGAGASAIHRQFFDPQAYRIVVLDQRGAGRSTPLGCLENNTTPKLIGDLERLRTHLAIERWVLFGGSWGSTLALAYAEAHPARVAGLVLRGVFLASRREIDWFMHGMRNVFPEAWRAFSAHLPPAERGDLLHNYYRRLTDPDPAVHFPAARAWDLYESACSALMPRPEGVARHEDDGAALAIARIEAHYFVNDGFLPEGKLLADLPRIRHIPCTIVQGRYDVVCPPVTADALAQAWPEAEYIVVPDAGHSVREPGITRELLFAVRRMQAKIRPH